MGFLAQYETVGGERGARLISAEDGASESPWRAPS